MQTPIIRHTKLAVTYDFFITPHSLIFPGRQAKYADHKSTRHIMARQCAHIPARSSPAAAPTGCKFPVPFPAEIAAVPKTRSPIPAVAPTACARTNPTPESDALRRTHLVPSRSTSTPTPAAKRSTATANPKRPRCGGPKNPAKTTAPAAKTTKSPAAAALRSPSTRPPATPHACVPDCPPQPPSSFAPPDAPSAPLPKHVLHTPCNTGPPRIAPLRIGCSTSLLLRTPVGIKRYALRPARVPPFFRLTPYHRARTL